MQKHTIQLNVTLDPAKMPEHIDWTASGTEAGDRPQQAKAFMLSLWDGEEKTAMRMDIWTKRMMVDEMNDFFVQTLLTMGDTYARATKDPELGNEIKEFAKAFKKKAEDKMITKN